MELQNKTSGLVCLACWLLLGPTASVWSSQDPEDAAADETTINTPPPVGPSNVKKLESAITKLLEDRFVRKIKVGVYVASLPDGQPIFDHNATAALMPASNFKLISTAAAMQLLGPDFRFVTQLAKRGDDLVVVGSGDPSLGDPSLTDAAGVPMTWMFDRWLATLERAGVKTICDILIDDSLFEPPAPHPSWPPDQVFSWYAAEVGALNFNTNCVDVRGQMDGSGLTVAFRPPNEFLTVENALRKGKSNVLSVRRPPEANQFIVAGTLRSVSGWSSITVHDPGLFFGQALATHLKAKGIAITGGVKRERVVNERFELPADCTLLARFHTPIWDCLRRANRQSQNLYAECLFKSVSAYAPDGKPRWDPANPAAGSAPVDITPLAQGSWAESGKVIAGYLCGLGLNEKEFHLDDGCGLSRKNRVSARVLTQVLVQAFNSPLRERWLNTLAASGLGGTTLSKRMTTGGLKGNVLGKTGFIEGVSALSGYVRAPGGKWTAFSVLCNDVPRGGTWQARELQDRIARAIFEALQD